MQEVGQLGWKILKKDMKTSTHESVFHHIWLGMQSIVQDFEHEEGPIYSVEEEGLRKCNEEQRDIGWLQIFLGRITKRWGIENKKLMALQGKKVDPVQWTTKLISNLWKMSLGLWQQRNQEEHGTTTTISLAEKEATANIISVYYNKLRPSIRPQDEWLFNKEEKRKISESYTSQIAWIDLVEIVCETELRKMSLCAEDKSPTQLLLL